MFKVPESKRLKPSDHPLLGSTSEIGNNGAFKLDSILSDRKIWIIASDDSGWEHVSLHILKTKAKILKTPTWEEMCYVKDIFWDDKDIVIQYHPKKSEYVNNHPNTLHLWRPTNLEIPFPESILVGYK